MDEGGDVVERRVFGPFGEVVASQIDSQASVPTAFTGKLYHDELSLYNFGARWYDPEAGRFVSIDPILQSVPDPQTHNSYTYVRNNPIGNVDPDGRESRNNDGNNNAGTLVVFVVGGLFGFGGRSKKSSPPPVPHGPPASGDALVAGSSAANGEGSTQRFGESTAKRYGGGSQSNQGLGQPVETNGPGPTTVPRLPDFFSINASVAIPTPWTGTLIGLTGSATVDENGNFYLGLGPSVGKTLTFVSGSAAFGWLNQKANPTEDDLRGFLTGHGLDAGGGFWGGGAITYSPSTGSSATNLGLFTPQAGGGYTYSWHVGDLWD